MVFCGLAADCSGRKEGEGGGGGWKKPEHRVRGESTERSLEHFAKST